MPPKVVPREKGRDFSGCEMPGSCYHPDVAKHLVHHVHTSMQLGGVPPSSTHIDWVPNTDIYETQTSFVVRMEVAGVTREDIHVDLVDRTLVVSGNRPDFLHSERRQFRQMEIHHGAFERRLVVPRNVDAKHIHANYRNGFLIIELPKVAKSEPTPLKVTIEHD